MLNSCHCCGTIILFGGWDKGQLRFCNVDCLLKYEAVENLDVKAECFKCKKQFPFTEVRELAGQYNDGKIYCNRCRKYQYVRLVFISVLFAAILVPSVIWFRGCLADARETPGYIASKVKDSLRREGIQGGVEPEIELYTQGEGKWQGVARFDQVTYDIEVRKEKDKYVIWRRKRDNPK